MPTPCESWPRRFASTRFAATCPASSGVEPAPRTVAQSGLAPRRPGQIMASSLVLPALLLAASLAGPAAAESSSDSPGQYRIYLQRGADGRAMLTDRPSAGAVTERSWQLEREDRA